MTTVAMDDGVELAVYERGSGAPTFLFLHGLACDHTFWSPQFDDLSRDHRCISIDFRGRGASPAAPPYDTTRQADDAAAVLRALDAGPAIVAGHSLGGLTALLLNDRHPELVLGIIAGDSPLQARGLGGARLAAALRDTGTTEPMRPLVESFWTESTPEVVKTHVREVMFGCPPAVAAGMLENDAVFAERMPELLRQADAKPFMAIWAAKPLGDPAWLRDVCTFLRQEPIAGAGHFFQVEQPAVTNALFRAFLDDVERDPRLKR